MNTCRVPWRWLALFAFTVVPLALSAQKLKTVDMATNTFFYRMESREGTASISSVCSGRFLLQVGSKHTKFFTEYGRLGDSVEILYKMILGPSFRPIWRYRSGRRYQVS